jgi:hypothetical protein
MCSVASQLFMLCAFVARGDSKGLELGTLCCMLEWSELILSVQALRQNSSILLSLASACVLREGQLIEVPGLGNGTSVCSDDSRMEDLPTTELLVLSPRQAGHPPQRSFPPVRPPLDSQR